MLTLSFVVTGTKMTVIAPAFPTTSTVFELPTAFMAKYVDVRASIIWPPDQKFGFE